MDSMADRIIERQENVINDYEDYLEGMIAKIEEKLGRQRDYAITQAEHGNFDCISPKDLIEPRVALETYQDALRTFRDYTFLGGKPKEEEGE